MKRLKGPAKPTTLRGIGRAIRCLNCGSRRFAVYRVVRNMDPNTEKLIDRIAVALCRDCGLIYQNPRIPEKQMDALYQRLEDKITGAFTDTVTEQENLSRLEALKKIKPAPARILEIGCSDGTFMNLARLAGYEVVGIDPSQPNCDKAMREYPELDVRCLFLDGFKSGETFDAICHFFVFEHVFHPDEFLSQIRKLLRPGGMMYFEIPNVESFARLPFANNLFTYQHTAHYSPSTVRAMLARYRYRTIAVDGRLGRSPKSYGMRVAATPAAKADAGQPRLYAKSRRLLDTYFTRRKKIVRRIDRRVRGWLKALGDRPGPVVIFGAGENGRILRSTSLMQAGRELYFCDNNAAIEGSEIEGLRVLAPAQAAARKPALVIAASIDYQDDMARQMRSLGVPAGRLVKLYEGF